ncbi:hypothetical protein F5Y17DRAFT_436543 [Xylariaceae sp. FL0594]|nr:hypothetical protein F5Y17DRAFT_436543 [Xylariaceae sp. FL0594]
MQQPSLKEKRVFFKDLEACRDRDEEADALPAEEKSLRQECRAFFSSVARPSFIPGRSSSSRGMIKKPEPQLRRTTSAPVYKMTNDDVQVIAVTPAVAANRRRGSRKADDAPSLSDTVIPETLPHPKRRPSVTRVLRSQSNIESSPSAPRKRKEAPPLRMAAESEQIFKGLKFFYIPNDDVNPARRLRIAKAREYGAAWTQDLAEATHVIVDKGLGYDDIRHVLLDRDISSEVVLVNDRYPLDCLKRREVFNPNGTVEEYLYRVPGCPSSGEKAVGETAVAREGTTDQQQQPLTQDSVHSLQIKPRRGTRASADVNSTQETTQRSIDFIPSSAPKAAAEPRNASTAAFTDELASCIAAVIDDPETHRYLDESDTDMPDDTTPSMSKKRKLTTNNNKKPTKKSKRTRSTSHNGDDDEGEDEFNDTKFLCMRGGTLADNNKSYNGPNALTIRLFEEIAEEHALWDETWRVQSYRKAASTLRRHVTQLCTAVEAAELPGIGKGLAEHVEEIATTGRFRKLEELRAEPRREALKLFGNLYGVGVGTARRWAERGYRTLEDLLRAQSSGELKLSTNQKIGITHYADLLRRIPRAEVEALGAHVKAVAAEIDRDVQIIIGGSYRRGARESGDIDLIVTKKGTTTTSTTAELRRVLDSLVERLTTEGFLTAALVTGGGNKWHGCCVLPTPTSTPISTPTPTPGSVLKKRQRTNNITTTNTNPGIRPPIWRRIDFLLVPESEMGAALIYFTGNDLFNRSMHLLARKRGLKLNHRALTTAGGEIIEGRDERRIFEILGVRWREPHERWC